jgi:hypothetical protein
MLPDRVRWTPASVALDDPDVASLLQAPRPGDPNPGKFDRICRFLKRTANVAIGVAAGGIPWTVYDFGGYGPTAMFGGFVLYLILMDLRTRLACE